MSDILAPEEGPRGRSLAVNNGCARLVDHPSLATVLATVLATDLATAEAAAGRNN